MVYERWSCDGDARFKAGFGLGARRQCYGFATFIKRDCYITGATFGVKCSCSCGARFLRNARFWAVRSAWRPTRRDPYAQVAAMCRSESSSHKSSVSDGLHGGTTCLHSFRHQEPSSCPAPATCDLVSEAMAEFVARLLISLEQSAGPTNAGVRVSRSQLPTPQGRELLSRATTGHGDRTLRRETSCARKLCRGLVGHERAQAAQILGHET